MKILTVVGARPNFMKIAPFVRAVKKFNESAKVKIKNIIVHTGQHYDIRMSDNFFKDLKIPKADIHLGVGSGTHAEQVGRTMIELEKVVKKVKPDWIVVVGDVNAICAGAIVAKKEHIKLAHIEAGLRSGDMSMPEEVNRVIADRLSDLMFAPDRISCLNLENEGVNKNKIFFVGNIMVDCLENERKKALKLSADQIAKRNFFGGIGEYEYLKQNSFALLTLHRPSNVDDKKIIKSLVDYFNDEVTKLIDLIWIMHPRTLKNLEKYDLIGKLKKNKRMVLLHPVGYHEMLKLNMDARVILTDSGGLQEESTVLGTPCLTLRDNTERPVTLKSNGAVSVLTGNKISRIRKEFKQALVLEKHPFLPELWDGRTAERIVRVIADYEMHLK
ncbi:MAG: UDP-N-acetylglucosamine 2-epimerase [Bacteroidetes bacterium GWF2_38_335]|nr:MAG: UDP-N-acetylglucosamine 2-epimerase [Bacteroidetes bacterium GWF2_38_335]OFY77056.1 MAG: UDP-N-acetylglucosamine 2-epimerase [Bacteroidetes bacterium RIFOXYA12_FULL_38_20]HBS86800.1 UDP-N-acetylglucosamine 2-epimerase (non-hydrolyzing) [Bacteroidales bacterium]